MQKQYSLVSLYDAHSEKEVFNNPDVISRAHGLAHALAVSKLGAIGRVGSSVVTTVLTTLFGAGVSTIGLSPAATYREHEKAFRLPDVSFPLVYTGRGALGADVVALTSSHGVCILGSDEEPLLGVLGYIGDRGIPITIFTEENPNDVRTRINRHYPNLMLHVFVSNEANKVVQELMIGIRRNHLAAK